MFDPNFIEGDDDDWSRGGRGQRCPAPPTCVNVSWPEVDP